MAPVGRRGKMGAAIQNGTSMPVGSRFFSLPWDGWEFKSKNRIFFGELPGCAHNGNETHEDISKNRSNTGRRKICH